MKTILTKLSYRLFGLGLLAAFTANSVALAEPFVLQNDLQMWQIGSVRTHISKRLLGYTDVQNNEVNLTGKPGLSTPGTHYGQLLVRPALGFQVNKYLSVWQGYGWTPTFQPQFRNENQIWEQLILERKFEHLHNLTLISRSRLEIRRLAGASGTAIRFRNQFRAALPLGNTKWSLVMYDEPFINLNTVGNGPRSGFNQNWLFLGINRKITKSVSAEIGYLNNYVNQPLSGTDRMNHVVMVSMSIVPTFSGVDLRRKRIDEPNPTLDKLLQPKTPILNNLGALSKSSDAEQILPNLTPGNNSGGNAPMEASLIVNQAPQLEILPISSDTSLGDTANKN